MVIRVLQGLITGLGFLGAAGVIIREQRSKRVYEFTAAASLWACALIGAAFGAGKFALGGLSLAAIGLVDLKSLPHDDLNELFEEIKVWCLYANGKTEKLPNEEKEEERLSRMRYWDEALLREAQHKSTPPAWSAFNNQLSLMSTGNMFHNSQT